MTFPIYEKITNVPNHQSDKVMAHTGREDNMKLWFSGRCGKWYPTILPMISPRAHASEAVGIKPANASSCLARSGDLWPSTGGRFLEWVPQNGWFVSWKIHLEMDENWRYPHFMKPPYPLVNHHLHSLSLWKLPNWGWILHVQINPISYYWFCGPSYPSKYLHVASLHFDLQLP